MINVVAPSRSKICILQQIFLKCPAVCRYISTNSAIHRGIRKSSWESGGFRSNDRDEGHRTKTQSRRELRKGPKIPRPNHLHQQDVEDMVESAKWKEATRSPKQQRYLEGGRKRNAEEGRKSPTRSKYVLQGNSARPSPMSKRVPEDRFTQYQTARSTSSAKIGQYTRRFGDDKNASDPYSRSHATKLHNPRGHSQTSRRGINALPNRAARRAVAFGHNAESPNAESSKEHYDKTIAPSSARMSPTEWRHPESHHSLRTHGQEAADRSTTSYGRDRVTDVPITVPYTTPASEFLYGASVVSAALRYSQRKFYKLYSYSAPDRANHGQDQAMRKLARSKGVEIMQVEGEWLRILDRMSTGRPHNVC